MLIDKSDVRQVEALGNYISLLVEENQPFRVRPHVIVLRDWLVAEGVSVEVGLRVSKVSRRTATFSHNDLLGLEERLGDLRICSLFLHVHLVEGMSGAFLLS